MPDFNMDDFVKGILNFVPGSDGANPGVGLAAPAFLAAMKQWNDAGKYKDTAREAADISNPFGDRSYYRDRLRQSYDDPSAILNDPGHKIQVARGLDNVASNNAAKGYLGSGNMLQDLSTYASDSDATYLDAERKQLGNLAGAQFDPRNAGDMLMRGNEQEINAQNGALSALLLPFLANMSQNRINNNGNGNPNTNTTDLIKTISTVSNPQDIANQIAQFAKVSGGSAASIMQQLLASNDISPSTANILNQMSQDPQYGDLFNTGGGTDVPPPGYSNGDPFGGFTNPDGSLNWQAIFQNPEMLQGMFGGEGGTPDFTFTNTNDMFGGGSSDFSESFFGSPEFMSFWEP